jgi:CBS domain-containing protein
MQTAAIPYRVADFLKRHPPFQFMDEPELIALAARGRVKFYEEDEYICWQSSPHTPFIYVIQQGSVSLWDESTSSPTLRDIRGTGDSIGIERFNGSPTSLHSAKAVSDTVVYALPAADFEPLLANNPQAARYVAAQSSVTADYSPPGERPHPHEIFLADLVRDSAPVLCPASTPIQQAACLLSESSAQAIALMDGGEVAALLTSADLLRWIAGGALNPEQPARNIARAHAVIVSPRTLVSDCILAMARSGVSAAALTSDGCQHGTLQSTLTAPIILTVPILAPAFGDHPVAILHEITAAPSVASLRALNMRARAWILDKLVVISAFDWLASWADFVNRRIVERLLQLTGDHHPEHVYCFYGAAGRQELLTSVAPRIAVIGAASASLETALAECGYLAPEPPISARLDEWKARFSGWIHNPIGTQVYHSRPLFDLRPVQKTGDSFSELESHIRAELAAEPAFLRVLANDCLSSLPPLTFFRDLVVEESGERTETFRLESSALQPLADVARVFSLASGTPLGVSTRERLQQVRRFLPAQQSIFHEAAETMRIVLFHQARAGLRLHSSGAELPLSILSRHDRQVLKSGFRSIHNLLEFAAPCEWLDAF